MWSNFQTWNNLRNCFWCMRNLRVCLHKGKSKEVVPVPKHHSMKTYWGVEVQLHVFYDLGTRWRWMVSFTPRPLYPQGDSPRYPFDRRLGGALSRYVHGVRWKNSQPRPGFEPRSTDRSQSLYRLRYPGSFPYVNKILKVNRNRS
jgi:hypothetical protein